MQINEREFWNRFDELTRSSNRNLTEICAESGIPYDTIITQRSRKSVPKIGQLIDMAEALKVSLDFLVIGKEQTSEPIVEKMNKDSDLKILFLRLENCSSIQRKAIGIMLDTWKIPIYEQTEKELQIL